MDSGDHEPQQLSAVAALQEPDWVQAHPFVLIFTQLRLRRVSDDVQVAGIRTAGDCLYV